MHCRLLQASPTLCISLGTDGEKSLLDWKKKYFTFGFKIHLKIKFEPPDSETEV